MFATPTCIAPLHKLCTSVCCTLGVGCVRGVRECSAVVDVSCLMKFAVWCAWRVGWGGSGWVGGGGEGEGREGVGGGV